MNATISAHLAADAMADAMTNGLDYGPLRAALLDFMDDMAAATLDTHARTLLSTLEAISRDTYRMSQGRPGAWLDTPRGARYVALVQSLHELMDSAGVDYRFRAAAILRGREAAEADAHA